MTKEKRPKRFECLSCGFVSDRYKQMKFPSMSFAICFKCRGKLKEREEWIDYNRKIMNEHWS